MDAAPICRREWYLKFERRNFNCLSKDVTSIFITIVHVNIFTSQTNPSNFFSGNEYIVRLLVEKGADVNAKDNKGLSPLQRAVRKGTKYRSTASNLN